MRLSLRLLALGVSGPLVGLGMFLAISAGTVMQLSRKANMEMTELFNQDNRAKLILATTMIQRQTRSLATKLSTNSERLSTVLSQKLRLDNTGKLFWNGKEISAKEASKQLNPILAQPITDSTERTSVLYQDQAGKWRRLAGVEGNGRTLPTQEAAPAQMLQDIRELVEEPPGRSKAVNSMLRGNSGIWRMTRLTPLTHANSSDRLLLAVSVRTDAANAILASSASLIPYKSHQAAFFGFTASGNFYCSYAKPSRDTCAKLHRLMLESGGIPHPENNTYESLSERTLLVASRAGQRPEAQKMFLATFPEWNWLAVILVEESKLNETLVPLQQTTNKMLVLLTAASVLLILGCAMAAWQIEEGIRRELNKLAGAADDIAAGRSRTRLSYAANDALGRLVNAFNRMAGAVAEREASLRERIRNLEIDINQQVLNGQVCSITQDPNFAALNQRAREMRARRNQRQADAISSASPDVPAS
jgi:HAMP domain-containing protein